MSTPRRPAPTTLAFHSSRIVVDVGVLIVMAAMSLPFVTSPSGNRSALFLDALPTVFLLVPIFLVTLIPDHTRPIPRALGWLSLVLGLAAFPYSIVKHADSSVLADTLGGSIGMGARLLVLGSFVTLVGISIGLARRFAGLESGGSPARTRAVGTRRRAAGGDDSAKSTKAHLPPDRRSEVAAMPTASDPEASPARTGGHPQPRPRPAPARPMVDENPFGSRLFDSLEIPKFVEQTFDAEGASERVADDDDG